MRLVIFGEWHEKSPLARRGSFNATEERCYFARWLATKSECMNMPDWVES